MPGNNYQAAPKPIWRKAMVYIFVAIGGFFTNLVAEYAGLEIVDYVDPRTLTLYVIDGRNDDDYDPSRDQMFDSITADIAADIKRTLGLRNQKYDIRVDSARKNHQRLRELYTQSCGASTLGYVIVASSDYLKNVRDSVEACSRFSLYTLATAPSLEQPVDVSIDRRVFRLPADDREQVETLVETVRQVAQPNERLAIINFLQPDDEYVRHFTENLPDKLDNCRNCPEYVDDFDRNDVVEFNLDWVRQHRINHFVVIAGHRKSESLLDHLKRLTQAQDHADRTLISNLQFYFTESASTLVRAGNEMRLLSIAADDSPPKLVLPHFAGANSQSINCPKDYSTFGKDIAAILNSALTTLEKKKRRLPFVIRPFKNFHHFLSDQGFDDNGNFQSAGYVVRRITPSVLDTLEDCRHSGSGTSTSNNGRTEQAVLTPP